MNTMLNDAMGTAKTAIGSARNGAGHAVETAKHAVEAAKDRTGQAATTVRSTFIDRMNAVSGVLAAIGSLRANDALGWIGLSRRRSPLASFGMFGAGFAAGAAIGAGAGLLLAPSSGAELRQKISRSIEAFGRDGQKAIVDVETKVEGKIDEMGANAKDVVGKVRNAVTEKEALVAGQVAVSAEAIQRDLKAKLDAKAGNKDTTQNGKDEFHEGMPGGTSTSRLA